LKDAQQLRLQLQRKFSHFVQEQRAAVRQFEAAYALAQRSGESALLVPQKFALEQTGRYGRAVEFDEGSLPAPAQLVNSPRDQFLSGAGLSLDQDGRIRGRRRFDLLQDVKQLATLPDHLIEAVFTPDLFLEIDLFVLNFLSQLDDFLKGQRVLDRDCDLSGDHLHELTILLAVRIELARSETQSAQTAMGRGERYPETASNLVAFKGFHHLGAEARLRIKVSHIERLLCFDHESGGSPGKRDFRILVVNLVFSRDSHPAGDRTLLTLLHYQDQEVESY
jgi:hypothetical protein